MPVTEAGGGAGPGAWVSEPEVDWVQLQMYLSGSWPFPVREEGTEVFEQGLE